MFVRFRAHVFYDVFVSLISELELVTLRRLLGVVAKQETRIIATLFKNGGTTVPQDYVNLYSMQFAIALPDDHVLAASSVSLFLMFAQVFNETYERMRTLDTSEGAKVRHYLMSLFDEMCTRFLDDRLLGKQDRLCLSRGRETCYDLSGSCTLKVLWSIVGCELSLPSGKTVRVGDELFACIHRYMKIIGAEAMDNPDYAGFATPTRAPYDMCSTTGGNVLLGLLTPFESKQQRSVSPRQIDVSQPAACINENLQLLLKFVIHTIMEIKLLPRDTVVSDELADLFSGFLTSVSGLRLSHHDKHMLWSKAHRICFVECEQHEVNAAATKIESFVLEHAREVSPVAR
ncbi:PACE efflux transporter [Babesia caballi]|uniref:PACE efflux transporter n=1 Tax=Babesia caballi TaxID=5871 RepID=A0AAV4LQZ6_BABCB|nr:PACE efflux transporter [Babesia caballi]